METKYWIFIAVTIFATWLFWDDMFGEYKDQAREDEFVFTSMDEDYKNLKTFINNAHTPALLDASFQLIIIFQAEYTGLEAEQKASNLIGIWEKKQSQVVAVLN